MQPVLTPAQMAAADRRAILAGTTETVLMTRAGHAVAREVRRFMGGTYGRRVVVVCGKGNNGGDGVIAAAVLRRWGARVDEFHLERGIDRDEAARAMRMADVVLDAMMGTGLRGVLTGDAAWVAEMSLVDDGPARVSIDIPSGVDGTTGAVNGPVFRADMTVCLAVLKTGLCQYPGRALAGEVKVVDIGIDVVDNGIGIDDHDGGETPGVGVLDGTELGRWLPRRGDTTHKWSSATLVVGGSLGMTGAPLLVGRAALRTGAGIVWCAVPGASSAAQVAGGEVIARVLAVDGEGRVAARAVEEIDGMADRFSAVVIGPGLGLGGDVGLVVRSLLQSVRSPVVLDADGMNALGGSIDSLVARGTSPEGSDGLRTIVTPHHAEFERLAGVSPGQDRLTAARSLARAAVSVVVLKGPSTVVAAPDGRAVIDLGGGPWLASAGTGDVLAGIVGGLLSRGVPAFEAAAGGVWLHSRAADVAGHTGLIAGDLVGAIASVRRTVEKT